MKFFKFSFKKLCSNQKKIVITTPIFYVNSKPHIGHLYTSFLASAIKQVHLLSNFQSAVLSTGTDEHGLKVQQKAKDEKIDTIEFCNRNSKLFKDLFDKAKIDYDIFIRTSDDNHKNFVKKFWQSMFEKGKINKREYSGYYSIQEESFVPEKDLIKKGDKFYTSLSAHSNQAVEYITEQNFQIKFEQEDIKNYNKLIETNKLNFTPKTISNEVKNYSNNLFDLCISRPSKRVSWGIEVPNDNEHVVYVWFEALLNYITILKSLNVNLDEVEFIHVIGKDISKFHCYIWPLMLLINQSFPAKITIIMHNYWLKNETKMSKSIGNVVDPESIIKKYGVDAIRFYFLAAGPLLHDVSFDEKTLSNIFYKNIPDSFINLILRLSNNKIIDVNNYNYVEKFLEEYIDKVNENMNLVNSAKTELLNHNFIQAAHYIHLILLNLNNLVQSSEFWNKTEDTNLLKNISCFCFEFLRMVTILYYPFLPELMKNVGCYIGMSEDEFNFKFCIFRGFSDKINLDDNISNFLNKIKHDGYFKIDSTYKSKIFISKIK